MLGNGSCLLDWTYSDPLVHADPNLAILLSYQNNIGYPHWILCEFCNPSLANLIFDSQTQIWIEIFESSSL